MRTLTSLRKAWWVVPAGLVLLSLVPAIAGTARLTELAGDPEITAANERFVRMPLPVMLHIIAVIPFSLLGAFQFSTEFRRRHRSWHRLAGRVLVVMGLLAALSGVWMTLTYPWANNDGEAVYVMRLLVGAWMTASILLAIDSIRRREFTAHGEWMIRGYAIGLGAGTQVFTHMPYFILVGQPEEFGRAVMMGAGWVINAVIAELIIRSARARREQTAQRVDSIRRGVIKPKRVATHAN
jgi:uncharacterized membrane protein